MSKKLDLVLVIDVESTCWEHAPPRGQISEIIEIGLCVVDVALLRRVERRSMMVKPMMSEVSPFCTQLTGITEQMLVDAPTLAEPLRTLRQEYRSAERLFASWGDYDRDQFQRNCQTYNLKYPFGPTHLNIKNLFSASLGLNRELGLDEACDRLGLTMEGTHHRGGDDAWNIARIFCTLLSRLRRASR